MWFTVQPTPQHFLLDGEFLTETFYVYHPLKHQHIFIIITYIYVFLNYWVV
jgi:hypothetical protein